MEIMIVITVLSFAGLIAVLIRYILIKKSLREIENGIHEKLNDNTNTLISVSSRDSSIRSIANTLNGELSSLRTREVRLRNDSDSLQNAITNIAHDIRTPLTSISGYLELLEDEDLGERPERYISVIRERTDTLRDLTEDLFDYSVAYNTAADIKRERLTLNEELEIALAASYNSMKEKGITPLIEISSEPAVRNLDRKALQRILSNFISNAVRYTDGDINISLDEKGRIIISNPAQSLSEIDVGRLFDRYYTVENAKGSTGLGLSIARLLTEKMGGKINAFLEDRNLKIIIYFPENSGSIEGYV